MGSSDSKGGGKDGNSVIHLPINRRGRSAPEQETTPKHNTASEATEELEALELLDVDEENLEDEDTGTVDPLIGLQIGNYVIKKFLSSGGMGLVYLAHHHNMGLQAAIKVLRPEMADSADQAARFEREARVLSTINHQGVTKIMDWGRLPDKRHYMTMEFLDGESLEELLAQDRRLSVFRALAIAEEVLDALMAAHKLNVIHRDLKPSNIYIVRQSDGARRIKLLDFGLAKETPVNALSETHIELGKGSAIAGTPEYIAPEQARGLPASARTDIYSLGVVLYEMLSGELPFRASNASDMMREHAYGKLPDIAKSIEDIPMSLVELLTSMLEKKPDDRPRNVDEVKQRIRRITRELQNEPTAITNPGSPPLLPLPPPPPPPREFRIRDWWPALLLPIFVGLTAWTLVDFGNSATLKDMQVRLAYQTAVARKAEEARKLEEEKRKTEEEKRKTEEAENEREKRALAQQQEETRQRLAAIEKERLAALEASKKTAHTASLKMPANNKTRPATSTLASFSIDYDCSVNADAWTASLQDKLGKYRQRIGTIFRINDENQAKLGNEFRLHQNAIKANNGAHATCEKLNHELDAWMRAYEAQARKQNLENT